MSIIIGSIIGLVIVVLLPYLIAKSIHDAAIRESAKREAEQVIIRNNLIRNNFIESCTSFYDENLA